MGLEPGQSLAPGYFLKFPGEEPIRVTRYGFVDYGAWVDAEGEYLLYPDETTCEVAARNYLAGLYLRDQDAFREIISPSRLGKWEKMVLFNGHTDSDAIVEYLVTSRYDLVLGDRNEPCEDALISKQLAQSLSVPNSDEVEWVPVIACKDDREREDSVWES